MGKIEERIRTQFDNLAPGWKDLVLELCSVGAHKSEIIKELKISQRAHTNFLAYFPEYAEVFAEGEVLAEAFYHNKLRTNLENKNFNNTLLIFYFKARFHMSDYGAPASDGGSRMPDHLEEKEIEEKFKKREDLGNERRTN